MRADDEGWVAFLDPRFSVLELNCRRGRPPVQYLDVVTGWRGTFTNRPNRRRVSR